MGHGGRQQCKVDDCIKCAHGGGFCISHGGGKRCSSKLCTKSAQAGGFCYSHGDAFTAWGNVDSDPWDVAANLSLQSGLEAEACHLNVDDKIREEEGSVDGEKEKEETDSLHVNELSELFSCVEQEEASDVDFGVFIEDEDAINVEEISELFSCLEESKKVDCVDAVASSVAVDKCDTEPVTEELDHFGSLKDDEAGQEQAFADAANIDMLSEMFSAALEDKDVELETKTLTYPVADCADAKNVDLVAELFTSLETDSDATQEVMVENSSIRDWIDALEVDNMSSLFAELEQADAAQTVKKTVAPVSSRAKVDSRVFVPKFSVRMDGQQSRRPVVGINNNLLVGPPGVLLVGPPALAEQHVTRENRVDRWKTKRKTRPFVTKPPDPMISDTRRASAAKRQRVTVTQVQQKKVGPFAKVIPQYSSAMWSFMASALWVTPAEPAADTTSPPSPSNNQESGGERSSFRLHSRGWLDRENELYLSIPKTEAAYCNVLFFPGDVQDFKCEMMAGPFADYCEYSYDNVAELLSDKFGDTCNVWVVRPSHFVHGAYSSFDNFVSTNEYGAATEYDPTAYAAKNLASLMQNTQAALKRQGVKLSTALPIHLLGFSKGGVVLNQLVTELINSIHWLDSGNGSLQGVLPSDELALTVLSRYEHLRLFVHVTPYQYEADTRPWIKTEVNSFVKKMDLLGADIQLIMYYEGDEGSLSSHFQILQDFEASRSFRSKGGGVKNSPEHAVQPVRIQAYK
ncbi:hypothetical protein BBP00_00002277 [Phytophthora kernoviae]|uniref:WRKY19-like zinc finger domain-containing protein n=1 Tax=Phytophthora kernoviae TaxID=325452 RepID=A0A3F2RXR1_9STRA|nr:hypothetical protein BBP00_00002277 [Phytophthora kernoviae]